MSLATAALILVATAALIAGAVWYRMTHVADKRDLQSRLDFTIGKFVSKGLAPGVAIGVFKDGRSFVKGYGQTSREGGHATGADTVFEIGSLTKLFTASALQQMCDAGRLTLDTTLAAVLGEERLDPAVRNITLRQLANHRSGLPAFPPDYLKWADGTDNISRDFTVSDMYAFLAKPGVELHPGKFCYSNFGAGLLGHVLELTSGQRYEELLRELLLQPLGMTSTFVTWPDITPAGTAQGYGMGKTPAAPLDWSGGSLNGAGSLKSSAADVLRLLCAFVQDPPIGAAASLQRTLPTPSQEAAIGWMTSTSFDRFLGNQDIAWHNGMTPGFASYVAVDPRRKSAIVLLVNRAVDVTIPGTMLMRHVRTQSWALKETETQGHPRLS